MADCPLGSTKDTEFGTEVRSAKLVTAGADISPDAINSSLARAFMAEAQVSGLPPGKGFWPVHMVMDYDPVASQLHNDVLASRTTFQGRVPRRMDNRLAHLKQKIFGDSKYKFSTEKGGETDQIQIATEALERTAKDGKVGDWTINPDKLEPTIPLSDKIVNFTKKYKDAVVAKAYEIRTGKSSHVDPILTELKFDVNDPQTYKKVLDEIWEYHTAIRQDLELRGIKISNKRGLKQDVVNKIREGKIPVWDNLQLPSSTEMALAIQRTFGMLDKQVGSDFYVPFNDGAFSFLPVANETANIAHDVRQLQAELAVGGLGKQKEDLYKAILQERITRLNELTASLASQTARQLLGQKILPKRHWTTSFLADNPQGARYRFDTDFDLMHRRLVWSNMGARHLNEVYDRARMALPRIKNQALNEYIVNWVDGIRGVKGYQEDAWIRWVAEKLTPWKVSETQIREWVTNIMKYQAITKLFLGPAFAMINTSQSVLTTMGLAGPAVMGRALARATRIGGPAWKEARALGLLGEVADSLMRESEAIGFSPTGKAMDAFMKKWPFAKLAALSEDFNRVLAYETGKLLSNADRVRLKPILKTLNLGKVAKGDTRAEAREWGKAFVNATQFILSKEGRPTSFVGGAHRRLVGQFRTFGSSYLALFASAMKNDPKQSGARMVAGLWFLAGLPGFPLYETIRNGIIKTTGHDVLPEWNGLSGLAERVGYGAWVPHTIDLTSRVEPFNFPRSLAARDLASTVLGPTFGPMVGLGEDISSEGATSPAAIKSMLRMVSPHIVSVGEAYSEYKRGGVFSPGGELIGQQNPAQLIARGLGLRPSVKQTYYQTRNKLKAALEAGNLDLVREISEKARMEGIRITQKKLNRIKGEVKSNRRKRTINEFEDIFFPKN